MPRDGSGIYSTPPGTDGGPPGVTIASTPYNVNVHDVEADLNAARPIIAGGTGANNATQARDNLDAEAAGIQVTNYDSHTWETGSFWSATGATGGPAPGTIFTGHAVLANNDPNYITLHATDLGTRTTYVRVKTAGVWGAWSGDLIINKASPNISLKKTSAAQFATIGSFTGESQRWVIVLADNTAETGSNAGSNFGIVRYDDAGLNIGTPLSIVRSTGHVTINNNLTVGGALISPVGVQFGGNALTGFYSDGTNVAIRSYGTNAVAIQSVSGTTNYASFTAAATTIDSGQVVSKALPASNSHFTLQDSAAAPRGILYWDRVADTLILRHETGTKPTIALAADGYVTLGVGLRSRAGSGGGTGINVHNFFWNAGATQAWVDGLNTGNITVTSDYRTKKDVTNLPGMWDTVKALRPIKYTQADFDPPVAVKSGGKDYKPMFVADDIERWGFLAHELQETMVDSAASCAKDAPDAIQSPNPWTILAAMTKALQEAMARIEALEAAQASP